MQSFIQYRKFRATAQAQIERDKAQLGNPTPTGESANGAGDRSLGSNKTDESKHGSDKDVERGALAANPPLDTRSSERGADNSVNPLEAQETVKQHEEVENLNKKEVDEHDTDDDDDDDHELAGIRTMSRQRSAGTALGAVLTGIEVRKRTTREGGSGNVFVVCYEGPDDPNDPHNWSLLTRIGCTFMIASIGFIVGFASAIDSSALTKAAKAFHVSEVAESLATGLFLIGFGAGSLFSGPISETVGRNPVYIGTLALYMIFVMASGLAPNLGAQLIFRFLAGFFGATPLTCAGGSISDLWSPMERIFAFPVFANAAFTGPLMGPVIGGFIAGSSKLSWRWVEWITLIISAVIFTCVVLFQPETYPQTLLKWKAKHLRDITGDERYRAEIEIRQEKFTRRLRRALYRPFLLTAREPMIILIALYLTVIYIILFTFLDGYTYIFTDTYGLSDGLTGLCFLGIIVGLFGASTLVPLIFKWAKRDLAKIEEKGGTRLPPEFRLWYSMLGGSIAVPVGLFWMGWTAYPHISIWSPLIASAVLGYGILCVFITCYQYIIDSYETFAASALASITVIRYLAAGGMVVVGIPFYENQGVHITLTVLGSLAALLAPVPYVFYKYGPWLRSKSKYAITDAV